jgi:nicotinamide mononucleotide (NMN) deamidase PncC
MKVLKQKGAVCPEVAEAMAIAALKLTPADVAIAVTGVAGPEPDPSRTRVLLGRQIKPTNCDGRALCC